MSNPDQRGRIWHDANARSELIVTFPAGTFGDSVRHRFTGHESLDCGGVSEVLVFGPGWEDKINRAIEEGLGGLFGA